jgi:acetyltransferase
MCFIDYDREMALVVTHGSEIVGVGRLHKIHSTADAEFAIVVADRFQGKGLGMELLRRLLDIAREEGIERVVADIHVENTLMQRMCEKVGFRIKRELGDPTVHAEMDLMPVAVS